MSNDSECLIGLSEAELEALAEGAMAPAAQGRLDELLWRQKGQQLTAAELDELDRLLEQVDHLTVLKTRARYTLHQKAAANRT